MFSRPVCLPQGLLTPGCEDKPHFWKNSKHLEKILEDSRLRLYRMPKQLKENCRELIASTSSRNMSNSLLLPIKVLFVHMLLIRKQESMI